MEAMRLDHVHIKTDNFRQTCDVLQDITGHDFLMEMPFDEMGMEAGYDPFPYSMEVMGVIDESKDLAKLYKDWPNGVFCLTFRVPDYETAAEEMAGKGYPQVARYDSPPFVKEGLFNTLDVLPFYIELIECPDNLVEMDASEFDLSALQ